MTQSRHRTDSNLFENTTTNCDYCHSINESLNANPNERARQRQQSVNMSIQPTSTAHLQYQTEENK